MGAWKMYVKRAKGKGLFLKRSKAYKSGGGSKILKFERTYFLNDPLIKLVSTLYITFHLQSFATNAMFK